MPCGRCPEPQISSLKQSPGIQSSKHSLFHGPEVSRFVFRVTSSLNEKLQRHRSLEHILWHRNVAFGFFSEFQIKCLANTNATKMLNRCFRVSRPHRTCLCEICRGEETGDKNPDTNVPLSAFLRDILSLSLCCPSNSGASDSEWPEKHPSARASDSAVTGALFRSISVMRREQHW